ncbi:MAG: queuosine precursor transporter [Pseudomonadota bacterium]
MSAAPQYRYVDLIMAGFVAVLLCSNLIGPAKVCELELPLIGVMLTFGAGNLFFPISYIFGDILTEVYGYARARRVIWAGFGAMIFASVMAQVVIHMPASPNEPYNEVLQPAIETVFGGTWRIVIASIIAFWVGDFVNAFVLAKMKVWSNGRHLWMRTIGSTIAGQGIDSLLFYPIAFYGIWSNEILLTVLLFNFGFKTAVEAVMTPATYVAVGFLKRVESADHYDRDTNFTPFSLSDH